MNYHQLGDLIHPDELNLVLEVSGVARVDVTTLYRRDAENAWVMIVPHYPRDGSAPALRRVRRDASGWRHFPMRDWDQDIAPLDERQGVRFDLGGDFARLPTWLCAAALDAKTDLRGRLDYVCECLTVVSFFPRYASLAELAVRVQVCATTARKRSCELLELLHVTARRFSADSGGGALSDCPSAAELLAAADAVLRAIAKCDIDLSATPPVGSIWLARCLESFDPVGSIFIGRRAGVPVNNIGNWANQDAVRLKPVRGPG